MTKKFTKIEMFQELSVKLAVIESKLDKVLDLLQEKEEVEQAENEVSIKILKTSSDMMDEYYKRLAQEQINKQEPKVTYVGCVFDKMSPEDRMKPMGLSCPCPKCTPYCLSGGSLSDSGTVQTWRPSGDTNL